MAGAATPAGATADLLRVENLDIEFPSTSGGWQTTVQDVSFSLAPGESMAIVGESGSGKTVTSLAVMGLTAATGGRISSGRVLFDGVDLTAGSERQWRDLRGPGMGMIFQQPMRSLNPAFTVGDQIAESVRRHLGMNRKQARARAVEMLDLVQIPRAAQRVDEYPHAFSGGMCQRVMIAMVMACNPRLLIADEPTTALDVTVQERILELLRDLQQQTGVALLFVSHDLAVVAELCQRVVVMYAGEVAESAPSSEIFFNPGHPYTSGLIGSIPKPGLSTDRRLRAIPGGIPAPGTWPHGCRFSNRCEHAQPGRCDVAHPALVQLGRPGAAGTTDTPGTAGPGDPAGLHEARCVRAHELSLDGVTV